MLPKGGEILNNTTGPVLSPLEDYSIGWGKRKTDYTLVRPQPRVHSLQSLMDRDGHPLCCPSEDKLNSLWRKTHHPYGLNVVSPQNSYVEFLMLDVMIVGGEALEGS